jgi:hypothetical protein
MSSSGLGSRIVALPMTLSAACFAGVLLVSMSSSGARADETWPSFALPDGPAPRDQHSAIYDLPRRRVLVFGGEELHSQDYPGHYSLTLSNEVWELTTEGTPAWNVVVPDGIPPTPRAQHTAIYDPLGDRMVIFGGYVGVPGYSSEVWELSLSGTPTWTMLSTAGTAPSPRGSHSAIYDPVRHRMLVFGGYTPYSSKNDTWELTLTGTPTWNELHPTGVLPTPRSGHVAAYDPLRDRMLIYGGCCDSNEVWSLDLAGSNGWNLDVPGFVVRSLFPSGPDQIDYHSNPAAAFDVNRNQWFIFGGATRPKPDYYADPIVHTSWTLKLHSNQAPNWVRVNTASADVWGRSAIYDRVQDRMILFGGQNYDHTLCCGALKNSTRGTVGIDVAGDPTAGVFSLLEVEATSSRVRLTWNAAGTIDATVERRTATSEWIRLATVAPSAGGRILYEDRDVVSDTRYAYRIEASGPDGRQVSNEAWVEVPSRIAFALDGASPNPVSGDLIVAFTLPSAAPASLDVFGADGRRVLHRRLDLEPGRHWVRTARSGEIAPGIYLIRLTQGKETRARRASVVR